MDILLASLPCGNTMLGFSYPATEPGTKGIVMHREIEGARVILADAIQEAVKRRKKLTLTEWESIIAAYDNVTHIVYGRLGRHGDGMPEQAKYQLARLLDQAILDLDPDND